MKKRILAIFLSLSLCVTAVPLEALADEPGITEVVQSAEEDMEFPCLHRSCHF